MEILDYKMLEYIGPRRGRSANSLNKRFGDNCDIIVEHLYTLKYLELSDFKEINGVGQYLNFSLSQEGKYALANHIAKKRQKHVDYFKDKWIPFLALAVAAAALAISWISYNKSNQALDEVNMISDTTSEKIEKISEALSSNGAFL